MTSETFRTFTHPYEKVFEATQNALMENRFTIKIADPGSGYILATGSEDLRAWFGQKIEVRITKAQNNQTNVYFSSSAKGPMVTTFGKTSEDVDDFFARLQWRLNNPDAPVSPIQPPLPPPPPPPSYTCKDCNEQLSYIEQYKKWYCNKCKKYA